MLGQLVGLPYPVDADHEAELAGPTGIDSGQRVLEHSADVWREAKCSRTGQVCIWSGFAAQVLLRCDHAVDSRLEQLLDSRGSEHFLRIGARRHHRPAQARLPHGPDVANRARISLNSLGVQTSQENL